MVRRCAGLPTAAGAPTSNRLRTSQRLSPSSFGNGFLVLSHLGVDLFLSLAREHRLVEPSARDCYAADWSPRSWLAHEVDDLPSQGARVGTFRDDVVEVEKLAGHDCSLRPRWTRTVTR